MLPMLVMDSGLDACASPRNDGAAFGRFPLPELPPRPGRYGSRAAAGRVNVAREMFPPATFR